MMPTREAVALEARSWIGSTPYRRRGMIKGAGVDCGSFIGCVWVATGIITAEQLADTMKEIEALADDWFMHAAFDKYVELMGSFSKMTGTGIAYSDLKVKLGNVVITRTRDSRAGNHGAIVVGWPKIIHCTREGIMEVDGSRAPLWGRRELQIYDPWEPK